MFVLAYVFICNEITVTNECHYHYRYNASLVSHSFNRNYLAEMNRFYDVLDKAISGHIMENTLRDQLKRLVMYFVYSYAGSMLQMGADVCYPQYLFPCKHLLESKKVVLFGAGKVGQSYYCDWKHNYRINIVMWVDSRLPYDESLKVKVLTPKKCISIDFDYVVCAVNSQMQAEEMKQQLINYGVTEDKILWEPPIDVFREYFLKR